MIAPAVERRLLQIVVALACFAPLSTGASGVLRGPVFLTGGAAVPVNLDSHFRYLSGIFLMLGFAFVSCVPEIERKGPRFRLLGAMVVCGGLARLLSLVETGLPSNGNLFGLGMEMGVVPLLMLWQWRVERVFLILPEFARGGGPPA